MVKGVKRGEVKSLRTADPEAHPISEMYVGVRLWSCLRFMLRDLY